MGKAKDIFIKPIKARVANDVIKKIHYSGKVVPNSQIHFGVFLDGKLEGAMQFGPSINKKGTMNLVKGTGFNEFIELNRMAFSDVLPKYSESRAIGITMRLIKNCTHKLNGLLALVTALNAVTAQYTEPVVFTW